MNSVARYILGIVVINLALVQANCQDSDKGHRDSIQGLSVSHDGNQLAFMQHSISGDEHVHSMVIVANLKTGELTKTQLPNGLMPFVTYGMGWSPMGEWLTFAGYDSRGDCRSIWRLSISSSKLSKMNALDRAQLPHRPLVSAAGNSILFLDAGQRDLMRFQCGTEELKYVTSVGDVKLRGYCWSPDGSLIYFSRGGLSKAGGIWYMRPTATEATVVNRSENVHPITLEISASGDWVSFIDVRERLFVSRLDDFAPIEVCRASDSIPEWSRGADVLVYRHNGEIRVWSRDKKTILKKRIKGISPVWVGGAESLAYVAPSKRAVWHYNLNTGEQKQLFPKR